MSNNLQSFRVKGSTDIHRLGGCIKKAVLNEEEFEIVAMGAPAVNQATKSMAVANSYLGVEGKQPVYYVPGFKDGTVIDKTTGKEEKKSFICWTPLLQEVVAVEE